MSDEWGMTASDQWTDAETCARRMGITLAQLDDFAQRGVVRARRSGWAVEFQPTIVNVTPAPAKAPAAAKVAKPRRAPAKKVGAPRSTTGP